MSGRWRSGAAGALPRVVLTTHASDGAVVPPVGWESIFERWLRVVERQDDRVIAISESVEKDFAAWRARAAVAPGTSDRGDQDRARLRPCGVAPDLRHAG